MTVSSLFSSTTSAASAYARSSSSGISSTTQAILDAVAKATGSTSTTSSGTGVSISSDAKLAAADAADNKKDFSTLATEVRKELDTGKADLTEMSGRALSAIILNRGSNFSGAEIASAKAELSGRTRETFKLAAGSGGSIGGLSAYNQQIVSQYDSMSDEEREARGWTSAMRSSAESFVQATQSTTSSLFDLLNSDDSYS